MTVQDPLRGLGPILKRFMIVPFFQRSALGRLVEKTQTVFISVCQGE